MEPQAVEIERIVRRMRGGSQSYLVAGKDGQFYVAKFVDNPQGNRTLINEWITAHLFQRLGVATPPLVILRLGDEVRKAAQDLCFKVGDRRIMIEPGLHLGSLCPVDPRTTAIYDFLPQSMLPKVSNVSDFGKALVVDTFLAQADSRQVIFVRERSKAKLSFCAYVIDHGMALGGSSWQLRDLNSQGLYFDRRIYSMTDTFSVCEHACAVLAALTEDELYRAAKDVPALWFAPGDYDALTELFTKLQTRKARLRTLVMEKLDTLRSSRSLTLVDFAPSKKSACIDSADLGNLVTKPAILPLVT